MNTDIMSKEIARDRLAALEQECRLRPTAGCIADLAGIYFTLDAPEKALPLALAAWEKNKDCSIGTNLAIILKDLGRHEEAFKAAEEAYWIDPGNMYTRLAYSEALLKNGFWKQAWPTYDNARPTQRGAAIDCGIPATIKEWNGSPLPEGHKLLVINEGGTGDRLNYARWLPELTKKGIDWAFFPYKELFSFFERILPRERLVADGDKYEPTHWTTTFALPAKLKVGPNEIPPALKFVAKPELIERFKFNRTDALPIVGLCYRAAELFQGGRTVRSLSEGQAMRLVCMTGDKVHWTSLQYRIPMPYPVTNIPLNNWEDTAAFIHNLDAVVTVDTGVFWLASAMGKKTILLLSANSCWKFLLRGEKCIWSPNVKMYRNREHGFEEAINKLVADIRTGSISPQEKRE